MPRKAAESVHEPAPKAEKQRATGEPAPPTKKDIETQMDAKRQQIADLQAATQTAHNELNALIQRHNRMQG